MHDLRYAFRLIRQNWGFSLTVIAILALCIGANTAVLAVVNGAILRPLPYPEPERLMQVVAIWRSRYHADDSGASNNDPDVIDWVIETFVETRSSLRLGSCATTKYYCFRNRAHHRFRELFRVAFPLAVSVSQSALSPEQTLPAVLSGFV